MKWFKDQNVKNAVCIGSLCSVSYFGVYVARHILGMISPQMIESGYSIEYIGQISSVFLGFYAVGQLINGVLGDHIKARNMMAVGLFSSGLATFLFSRLVDVPAAALAAYGLAGFFLSMIYGPMTKTVSENTDPQYTPRCTLGYTVSSLLSSPVAGGLAAALVWFNALDAVSLLLCVMAIVCYVFFLLYEKQGVVRYVRYQKPERRGAGVKTLIKRGIIRFIFIAMLTGVVRTTVAFWLPTFFTQYLGYPSEQAVMISTIGSFVLAPGAILTIFIYEKLGRNMNLVLKLMFGIAFASFVIMYFVRLPLLNVFLIELAVYASTAASTMMYSRYCPSLYDTGMVSSATGFLDFISYAAATLSSTLFANAVSDIGWQNLILVWAALMGAGVVVAFWGKHKENA